MVIVWPSFGKGPERAAGCIAGGHPERGRCLCCDLLLLCSAGCGFGPMAGCSGSLGSVVLLLSMCTQLEWWVCFDCVVLDGAEGLQRIMMPEHNLGLDSSCLQACTPSLSPTFRLDAAAVGNVRLGSILLKTVVWEAQGNGVGVIVPGHLHFLYHFQTGCSRGVCCRVCPRFSCKPAKLWYCQVASKDVI